MKLLIVYLHPSFIDLQRHCVNEYVIIFFVIILVFTMILVFHIILQNHVIILSVDFIDKGHPK